MKLLFTASWKRYSGIETHGKYGVVGERGKARENLGSIPPEVAFRQKEQEWDLKEKW